MHWGGPMFFFTRAREAAAAAAVTSLFFLFVCFDELTTKKTAKPEWTGHFFCLHYVHHTPSWCINGTLIRFDLDFCFWTNGYDNEGGFPSSSCKMQAVISRSSTSHTDSQGTFLPRHTRCSANININTFVVTEDAHAEQGDTV